MHRNPLTAQAPMILKDYPGSKGGAGVWQRIISEMPPHQTYIEPFLGSGVVLRKKLTSTIAIGVDASSRVIAAWNRSVHAESGAAVRNAESGASGHEACHAICGDALSLTPFLVRSFPCPALVYADPPYLRNCHGQPRTRRYYDHEILTAEDHQKVLAMLKALPCNVIISGYWSELYAEELPGWRTVQIPSVTHRGKPVIEWLWCNFPEPVELHDYRFVGCNYRERWRLEKMRRRWKVKLEKMSAVQRRALLWAASQVSAPGTALGSQNILDPAPVSALRDLRAGNGAAAGCSAGSGAGFRKSAPEMALGPVSADTAENGAPRGNGHLSPDRVTNCEMAKR